MFRPARVAAITPGTVQVSVRATDVHGTAQPQVDGQSDNGSNGWPEVTITVVDAQ